MALPSVVKPITNFGIHRLWSAFFVWLTIMVIDYAWYGLISPSGNYFTDFVGKCIWTAVFSMALSIIYNHAAIWRPNVGGKPGSFGNRFWNSLFFSLTVYMLILAALALSCYVASVVYIYILHGFRGYPDSITDDSVLAVEIIASGLVLELCGKDETKEGRTGG